MTTILSYNVWNSKPPEWIFHTRSEWNDKRIDHFAALILASGADVVGLEVRWEDAQATDATPIQYHTARRLGKGWQHIPTKPGQAW